MRQRRDRKRSRLRHLSRRRPQWQSTTRVTTRCTTVFHFAAREVLAGKESCLLTFSKGFCANRSGTGRRFTSLLLINVFKHLVRNKRHAACEDSPDPFVGEYFPTKTCQWLEQLADQFY